MKTLVMWISAAVAMACSSDTRVGPSDPQTAGLNVDPVIQSIVPEAGVRGATLEVRVLGRGFDEGSQIHFERDGVPTDDIETNSTTFVDSQELVANITIDAAARTGRYSIVVVTTGDKRGIGLEFFLVLEVLGNLLGTVASIATDVNENGEVVGFSQVGFPGEEGFDGHHALYWFASVLEDLGVGQAFAINGACEPGSCRVVGVRDNRPVMWQKQGGVWTNFELPTESGRGFARAINDRGDQIAGSMMVEGGSTAVVWTELDGSWSATELPSAPGSATAINNVGQVLGQVADRAVVWTSGGGGWTPQELPPLPGDLGATALGINDAGDIVGESGFRIDETNRATLWKRNSGGWDPPIQLVPLAPADGVTSTAYDINNKGEIVGTIADVELELDFQQEAFLWTEQFELLRLGRFEGRGTVALAISENNQISGSNSELALLWHFSID